MKYIKLLHKLLIGKDFGNAWDTFSRQHESFQSAYLLVRFYYVAVLFIFVSSQINKWQKWLDLDAISPLWPVTWVWLTGIQPAVYIIMTFALITTIMVALFPEKRLFRILLFLGMFELIAFGYSFGKIGHSSHAWLMTSFVFIFLPDGKKEQIEGYITRRQIYLTTFGAAQALIMLFFSLSGFWKLIYAFDQLFKGQVHAFSPDAFAHIIANRLLQTNSTSIIGNIIIENPILGWPMYVFTIYLELFAFVAAFRPSLHRFWGFFLILFHLGSYLILGVGFSKSIFILAIFFLCSPFVPAKNNLKNVICNLPLFGFILGLFTRGIKSIRYSYNGGYNGNG